MGMRMLMHIVSLCVACVFVYVYLFAKYMLNGVVRVCLVGGFEHDNITLA